MTWTTGTPFPRAAESKAEFSSETMMTSGCHAMMDCSMRLRIPSQAIAFTATSL